MIVADTNLIAYLLIEGDHTPAAEAVMWKDAVWAAPRLWRSEFCNVLALYLRQGHLTLTEAQSHVDVADALIGRHAYDVPPGPVLELVFRSGCSAYDAEFVYLATSLQIPLVTSDRKLLGAFPSVAIAPEGFAP